MQLDILWNYMQHDMEAERFETAMRNAPDRIKVLEKRDFLLAQQNNMKRIEREIDEMKDRMVVIQDEITRLQGLVEAQYKVFETTPPETLEAIEKQRIAIQRLVDSLQHYVQELNKMRKDSNQRDRMQKEIRLSYARTKSEYDELKKKYEVEFSRDKAKLAELKARVESEGAKVDAQMLSRYRSVKQHITPPMAKVNGDRCSCCNMAMPVAVMEAVGSDKIVECDNCGRILLVSQK